MIVDTQAIVDSFTKHVERKLHLLPKDLPLVSEKDYVALHSSFLQPTTIKLDIPLIKEELGQYKKYFVKMPHLTMDLPRYAIPLTNETGILNESDPACVSFHKLNDWDTRRIYLDSAFDVPTPVYYLSGFEPLRVFDNHFARTLFLYWTQGGLFVPHIDTLKRSSILRLWMGTENITLRYAVNNELVECEFEPGRVYIIDTSIVHDAQCNREDGYQLFMALKPSGYDKLLEYRE